MSTVIQRRRGTTAQHAAFTGLVGETTVDTDKKTVVVHDGSTAGGFPLKRDNVSAQYKILGRSSSGAGATEEITSSSNVFSLIGAATYAAFRALLGLDTGDSPMFTAINVGHASDTTLARASAGRMTCEGSNVLMASDYATDAEARAVSSSAKALTPANLAGRARFRAHKNATDQTGISAAAFTLVTFGTEVADVGSYFASNTWTPPAGPVRMSATVGCTSVDDGFVTAVIYKNGVLYASGSLAAHTGNEGRSTVTATDEANGTDAYTVRVFAGATGTYDVSGATAATHFEGEQI